MVIAIVIFVSLVAMAGDAQQGGRFKYQDNRNNAYRYCDNRD
jgi:hypothetical protein